MTELKSGCNGGNKTEQASVLQFPTTDDVHGNGGGSGSGGGNGNKRPDGLSGLIQPKSSSKPGTTVFNMTMPHGSTEMLTGSGIIDEKLSTRDQEKMKTLAKQRENYLNSGATGPGIMDSEVLTAPGTRNAGVLKRIRLFMRDLFCDVDSHTEHLFYLTALEMFFIFLTYTHYSYFDKKNRFLTPIVMGGETSLLAQTLSQLFNWTQTRTAMRNRMLLKALNDEEMSVGGGNCTTNSKSSRMREMHSRNSSINTTPISLESSSAEPSQAQILITADKDASLRDHIKFLTWGGVNGLLCSYWIELLLTMFKDRPIMCVLADQSVGTVIFQTLYSLFVCLWDGEIEVYGVAIDIADSQHIHSSHARRTVDLTWENFTNYYAGMLWRYMKLSYLMWPVISVLCFTVLSDKWIFPVNCFFSTLFGVTLGM